MMIRAAIYHRSRKKLPKLFFIVLGLGIFFGVGFGAPVLADTDTPISSTSPTSNSANYTGTGSNFTPWTGVGVGGFEGRVSWVKVYVPVGQTTTITIEQNCGISIGAPKVNFRLRDLSDKERDMEGNFAPISNWRAYDRSATRSSSQCNDVVFNINDKDYGIPSVRPGHQNYRVFYLRAEMATGVSGSSERYFRFKATNGTLLGLANAIDFSDINPSDQYFTVYNGNGTWDYSVRFGPRCDISAGNHTGTIKIKDPDNGIYQNNMHAIVQRSERSRINPNWSNPGPNPFYTASASQVQGSPWGGNNTVGQFSFNTNKLYVYKLIIRGSSYPNTIQVQLPFDQFDGNPNDVDCSEGWYLDNSNTANYNAVKFDYTQAVKPTVSRPPNYSAFRNCNDYSASSGNRPKCQAWNAYYRTLQDNTNSARTAIGKIRMTQRVGNTGKNGQKDWIAATGHQTVTQYKYTTAAGCDNGYKDRFNGQGWTASINPGQWRSTGRSPTTPPFSSNDQCALRVVGGASVSGYTGNADKYKGGDPRDGDRYCERITTDPRRSPGGGSTSAAKCVRLSAVSDECDGQPWQVISWANTRKTGGDGDGNLGGAWVGDSYAFRYRFNNSGPAERTSTINFRHIAYDVNSGGPDYTWSNVLGTDEADRRSITIQPSDAGRTFKDNVDWAPNSGTYDNADNKECTAGGNGQVWAQDVHVPFYYHQTPNTGVSPSAATMQQGEPVNATARINLPEWDTGGDHSGDAASDEQMNRRHTYSDWTNWKVIEFETSDINITKSIVAQNRSGGSGNCGELNAWGVPGFACANDNAVSGRSRFTPSNQSNQVVEGDTNFTYTRTARIDPVGKNICFVTAINRPTQNGSPAWRYSAPVCKTVVKSPKVQFMNGDVTVGRPVDMGGGGPSCTPVNARIQTTPAPNVGALGVVAPGQQYLYGSWVEYGAFATGAINSFGTSGEEAGNPSWANRLAFTNENSSQLGRYQYSSQCLGNLFSTVAGDVNTISAPDAANLQPHTYFIGKTDKNGYVSNGNDVHIKPPVSETYKARVTITAASEYGNDRPGVPNTPAVAQVGVSNGNNYNSKSISVTSAWPSMGTYSTDIDLGVNGYKGPQNTSTGGPAVTVRFANNNHNNFWDTDSSNMTDRNLILSTVKVEWIKVQGGTESVVASTPVFNAQSMVRTAPQDYYPVGGVAPCVSGANNRGSDLWMPSTFGDNGYMGGNCYGVHLNQSDLGFPAGTPPPPVLNNAFDGFRGRDIVVYAKKKNGVACSPNPTGSTTGGNLYLSTDIDFSPGPYSNIKELPRVILMADCHIVIDNNVNTVNASLVAGESIRTCTTVAKRDSDCNTRLYVNGLVQAKSLLLWRTGGADLTNLEDAKVPAETFNLRPDQILSAYGDGATQATPRQAYQIDLPPRY